MKLGITGSRSITEFDFIPYFTMRDREFRAFCRRHGLGRRKITAVITGGARGIDTLAFQAAEAAGIRNLRFLPDRAKFRGKTVLTPEQYHCRFEDSIGLINDWTKPAEPVELPYSGLLPEKIRGLLAAGRCISVQGEAVERVRVIPVAAMTGQTAGFAASIAVKKQLLPDEVPIALLQEKLQAAGFILHR